MSMISDTSEQRAGGDRRLLPRADNGRREPDYAERQLVTDASEEKLGKGDSAIKYVMAMAMMFVVGLVGVHSANTHLAPMLNDTDVVERTGRQLAYGNNYLTYDLNIETRQLKEVHVANLDRVPELIVLGASHWQEAHSGLAKEVDMFNNHTHRDYWEDLIGVTDTIIRAGKLPPKMMIAIRDNQFKPFEDRTDFLWVPGLENYRKGADRLGIAAHDLYADGLTPQLRQKLSLPWLKMNVERYLQSPVAPTVSDATSHPTLDVLLADGSIVWSDLHMKAFTAERARADALAHAASLRDSPPKIDPVGLASVDALFAYLAERGVEVYLTHPPFNPIFWEATRGSAYAEALVEIEKTTQALADKHGFEVIGSFNPHDLGCTEDQYIDGEHANADCLGRIFEQFLAHDRARRVTAGRQG